jgi:mono/diheme cytochrome c family protein
LAGAYWLLIYNMTLGQDAERGGPAGPPTVEPAQPIPAANPTIDRLAAPPTVPAPNQADEGAQLFWLHCQPCHGDQGQGLTDEWRAQYPIEDQYCWNSGCHGDRPYDPAFTLPTAVPAVIGEGTLSKFQTMDGVFRYVSVTMPYFFPGDLTEEEYLAIVAHLAREHGIWDGMHLTANTLINYPLSSAAVVPAQVTPEPTPPPEQSAMRGFGIGATELIVICLGSLVLLILTGSFLWLRRGR